MPRRFTILPLALSLLILGLACSSGNGSDDIATSTPAGSGQIPVENPDGTGRPNSGILTGDARRGLASYQVNGCSTCHSGEDLSLGPSHANIFQTAATRKDGVTAEEYIIESITQPDAFVVPGFPSPSTMPSFAELTEGELNNMVAYMKTLNIDSGDAPPISVSTLPAGSVDEGRRLYGTIGCSGCHSQQADRIVGPGFEGLATRASSRKAGLTADEYIVESIVNPLTFVVDGFPRQMPVFSDLSTQQIADLLAFLKTFE